MTFRCRTPLAAIAFLSAGFAHTLPAAAADTKTFTNAELKYTVALPATCRIEEGPGTLEAICAPDLSAEKSAAIPAAGAFLLEIDAEPVPGDAKAYAEAEFRQELPEAVCGESDAARVVIGGFKQSIEAGLAMLSAEIRCPEIKFLGLPERKAFAKYILAERFRYRLLVRAPASDLDRLRPIGTAFIESFKTTAGAKP